MKQPPYSPEQYAAFQDIVKVFRKKEYLELKRLADEKFNDTVHPRDDVQIGIDLFYDDKKLGYVRCSMSLYTVTVRPWWHFWDTAVLVEDFILAPDGVFIGD